jgi:hypothetical protein
MKGMELPISTIVIIVIVLVVLLAVIAFFFGVWNPGVSGINLEGVKNNACQILVSTGCVDTRLVLVNDFDADRDGTLGTDETGSGWTWGRSVCGGTVSTNGDNLAALCQCYYGILDEDSCKSQICNCRD